MKTSADYKAEMDKYESLVTINQKKLDELEKELEKKREQLKKLTNSGIVSKLDQLKEKIDTTATKLSQASKYMTNIVVVKGRPFDNGELGTCSSDLLESGQEVDNLLNEIKEAMNVTLPREIEDKILEIQKYESRIAEYQKSYNEAKKNYELAVVRETGVVEKPKVNTPKTNTGTPVITPKTNTGTPVIAPKTNARINNTRINKVFFENNRIA